MQMNPAKIFLNCSKNQYYLLKEYSKDFIVLMFGFLFLIKFHIHLIPSFQLLFIIFLMAIPFGWMVASFLHNTGHANIKNKFLNKIIGEFCGHFVGYGFSNFILVHTLHHKFSDNRFDPVSPEGMSFLKFLLAPTRYMITHTKDYLIDRHGKNDNYEKILSTQSVIFYMNLVLRQICWFMLLGPALYIAFYLPAVLSNILILAHINYVCHRDNDDGSVEIFNLNHNLYYKIANAITFGGYYHKSHHLHLSLFDPRDYAGLKLERALITVQPHREVTKKRVASNNSLLNYFNLDGVWGNAKY
jgi:fatty acid desaturase